MYTVLGRVTEFKLLGVNVQNDLKWNADVSSVVSKASKRICHLRASRKADLPKDIGLITFLRRSDLSLNTRRQSGVDCQAILKTIFRGCKKNASILLMIGLPSDTVEPLAIRRKNLTRKEFKRILESESHLYSRFITNKAADYTYNLRSNSTPSKFTAPAFYTNRLHNQLFLEVLS